MPTSKSIQTRLAQAGLVLLGLLHIHGASAQAPADASNYPSQPVKLVVPYPPGGGADFLARLLAEKAQTKWGQTVIVENRSGAGGNVGTESVFRANPDGYTLLFTAQPPLVANKSLYAKLNFDPDIMTPVSIMTTGYSVLMVHPKLPVNSVAELIAYAKANPNKLNYASQGIGNAAHLSAELFCSMAGIKMTHIPYKGTGPALADALSGQVEVYFGELATSGVHVRAGKLKLLAVGGEKRLAVGNEEEVIRFGGIVSPVNLQGNTILSSQVADARIEYRGAGITDEVKNPGWLTKLFVRYSPN